MDANGRQVAESVVAALGDTVTSLLGGVQQMGAAAALPTIEGWERRLVSLGNPEFAPIAQVLTELKTQLSVDGTNPQTVGALLLTLGVQVAAVAESDLGAPVSGELGRLSVLLTEQGSKLAEQGRR